MRRAVIVCVATLAWSAGVSAQYPPAHDPSSIWSPNGAVRAIARDGDTLFVGGLFDYVGPPTGRFAVLDHQTGRLIGSPGLTGGSILGSVEAIAPTDDGGWVLTGREFHYTFTNGGPSPPLIKVNAAGQVDPAFRVPTFGGGVPLVVVSHTGCILVGGTFTSVNGLPQSGYLVALDGSTGAVLSGPATVNGPVYSLKNADGALWIGGTFTAVNGQPRSRLAAIDLGSGALLPFAPSALEYVYDITAAGDRVFVSGRCTVSGFEYGRSFCALSRTTGELLAWHEYHVFSAGAMEMAGGRLYVATTVIENGGELGRLMALDPVTLAQLGTLDDLWGFNALAVEDGVLHAGGRFTSLSGQPRLRLAAFDPTSFTLLPWAVSASGTVTAMAFAHGRMAVGGGFGSVGGIPHTNLAAIDLKTGFPVPRVPRVSEVFFAGGVNALATAHGIVFVGGHFLSLGDRGAARLGAFNARTGDVYPWVPFPDGSVNALATDGEHLFVGGAFSTIAGQPRQALAAFHLPSQRLTAWNPRPNGAVRSLRISSGAVYALGQFTTFPGFGRHGAAAFDTATGDLLPWDPGANGAIADLAFFRDRILVAGGFTQLRRQPRSGLGWVDRMSGEPRDLPPTSGPAWQLARTGDTIVLAGINDLDGQPRGGLGAMAAVTGRPLAWIPQITSSGLALTFEAAEGSPDLIALGGQFTMLNYRPSGSLAIFRTPTPGPPVRMQAQVRGSVVSLQWSEGAEPSPTSYVLEAGTGPGLADVGVLRVGVPALSSSLATGTYYVRVRGQGTAGLGGASSEVVVTVPSSPAPPGPPQGLRADVHGRVTLSWVAAPGNAERYLLEAGSAPGLTDLAVFDTGNLDTTFSVAAPPGHYFVRVRAMNAAGRSGASNEVTIAVP